MRTISRNNRSFQVTESWYNNWDFWKAFAEGTWEPNVLAKLIEAGPNYIYDIGAWVGPITLWAASHGIRVLAVEPDWVAYKELEQNVKANNFEELVKLIPFALSDHGGFAQLGIEQGGGISTSSVARTGMEEYVEVPACKLEHLVEVHGLPDLIKIDIEGGEGTLIPLIGPYLREHGIPMLLSSHMHWFPEGAREGYEEELSHWQVQDVENDTRYYFVEKQ